MSAEIGPSVVASAESAVSEVVASQVSVRDLKTHLSEWLGRVQAGEVVEVTSHRKPIARITAEKPANSGITSSTPILNHDVAEQLPLPSQLHGRGQVGLLTAPADQARINRFLQRAGYP